MVSGTARRGLGRGMGMPLTEEQRRQRHELMFGGNPGRPIVGYLMELRVWFRERPKLRELATGEEAERVEKSALF